MKPEFSRQIFEKYSNSKFYEIRREGAVFVHGNRRTDGRTNDDITKLIFALRNFSITPNNSTETTPTCFGKSIYHLQEIHVPTANHNTGYEAL
jgi:hypothetical protein